MVVSAYGVSWLLVLAAVGLRFYVLHRREVQGRSLPLEVRAALALEQLDEGHETDEKTTPSEEGAAFVLIELAD